MKLTKEECLEALHKIEEVFGCDMAYYNLHEERDCLKMLINEHFDSSLTQEKLEKAIDKAIRTLNTLGCMYMHNNEDKKEAWRVYLFNETN